VLGQHAADGVHPAAALALQRAVLRLLVGRRGDDRLGGDVLEAVLGLALVLGPGVPDAVGLDVVVDLLGRLGRAPERRGALGAFAG
jgi:hypothetical protein